MEQYDENGNIELRKLDEKLVKTHEEMKRLKESTKSLDSYL